jgi:hypothetical protein
MNARTEKWWCLTCLQTQKGKKHAGHLTVRETPIQGDTFPMNKPSHERIGNWKLPATCQKTATFHKP